MRFTPSPAPLDVPTQASRKSTSPNDDFDYARMRTRFEQITSANRKHRPHSVTFGADEYDLYENNRESALVCSLVYLRFS